MKMEQIPIKKRKFWSQSSSPPPQPHSPHCEGPLSSHAQDSALHLGGCHKLVNSVGPSEQKSLSNQSVGALNGSTVVKPVQVADEVRNGMISEDVCSGIELLASVAEVVRDNDPKAKKDFCAEEFASTEVKGSSNDLSCNFYDEKYSGAGGEYSPSKKDRLCWDLNKPMEEWDEPYQEISHSQKNDSGSALDDGMQTGKVTLEACKTQNDCEDTESEIGTKVHSSSCGQELEAGYDSPFEEGEVRETDISSCNKNKVDFLEIGQPDNRLFDIGSSGANDRGMNKMSEGGNATFYMGSDQAVENCIQDGWMTPHHLKSSNTKVSGWDQLPERQGYVNAEGNRDELRNNHRISGGFRATHSREKFSSHVEGEDFHPIYRNKSYFQRQRSDNPPYYRLKENFVYGKSFREDGSYSFPRRGEHEAHGPRFEFTRGHRSSGNPYSHNYRTPRGHNYSMPRGISTDSAAEGSALNYEDNRLFKYYSSDGMNRLFSSRSPAERDDNFFTHRGEPSRRGGRGRSRSGMYAKNSKTGPMEEYDESVPDNANRYSPPIPLHYSRRGRSFYPNIGRDAHFSRSKNFRLRSRSPIPWEAQREQRWSPPVRRFNQSQRCSSEGYVKRSRSVDNSRPFGGQEFSSSMAHTGRRENFQGSDDLRRRHNDSFEMTNGERLYDSGGNVRRLHRDADDLFEPHYPSGEDDYSRITFRRNVPERAMREMVPLNSMLSERHELNKNVAQRDVARGAGEKRGNSEVISSFSVEQVSVEDVAQRDVARSPDEERDPYAATALISGQQELQEEVAPRNVAGSPREERAPCNTIALLSGQQKLEEDTAPRDVATSARDGENFLNDSDRTDSRALSTGQPELEG